MKKRLLALAAFLALTLAGCGQSAQPQQEEASTPPATTEATETEVTAGYEDGLVTQVASLKGPTSMGLSALMTSENEHYEFNIYAAADEIVRWL